MPTDLLTAADAAISPRDASLGFSYAVAGGDVDAAMAGLSSSACVITPDRTTILGDDGIALFLRQLSIVHPEILVESGGVLITGGIAFCNQRWTVTSKGSDDERFERVLPAQLVLREERGRWKVLVAAPWGL